MGNASCSSYTDRRRSGKENMKMKKSDGTFYVEVVGLIISGVSAHLTTVPTEKTEIWEHQKKSLITVETGLRP